MVEQMADNASRSFRCRRCGHTFPMREENENTCPTCGFKCNPRSCRIVEASDEGY